MNPLLADAAIAANHCPDTGVRELISSALRALEQLPQHLETWQAALAQDRTLADCLMIKAEHLAQSKLLACTLCDRGDFLLALPLAVYCASFAHDDPDHSFLAGACLQRLGQPAAAAHFYRIALQLNEADAASAYRLGECLEATGNRDAARHLYQWTVELARGNFSLRRLQDMAGKRLEALRIT